MPFFNINNYFPTLIAKVFASNYLLGIFLAMTISVVRALSSNQDFVYWVSLGTHIAFFLVVGLSNFIASYKDVRKPIGMHPLNANLVRALILWSWSSFIWLSLMYFTNPIFRIHDAKLSSIFEKTVFNVDVVVLLSIIAIFATLEIYPKMELQANYLWKWRIGLIAVWFFYFFTFFAIFFELDHIFKSFGFKMIEISYFIITNCIVAMMAGIDREVVRPYNLQNELIAIVLRHELIALV
jgi:hypothetical protein